MNNEYRNEWHNDEMHVPQYNQMPKPKQKKNHTMAIALAVSVLCSSVLGFTGGMLAGKLDDVSITKVSDTPTATTQVQPTKISGDASAFNASAVAAAGLQSVVEITTESLTYNNSIMGQYVSQGAGSGVIISEDGYIATNNHVVNGATKITVRTHGGEEYRASLIGTDEKTDLAVIKIEAKGLAAAQYGDSGNLLVGQNVLAIGNPLGELGGTVTQGIISALDREVEIEGQKMRLLQTDASVNPGNSGGGLFDGNGKLVGIVNAKSSGSGIEGLGFAIPINTASDVIDELINNGYVTGRVEAGITVVYMDEDAAYMYRLDEPGVYIYSVTGGSAADKAGLRSGDQILTVDGKEIKETTEVVDIVQSHKVGDSVDFKVKRDGKETVITVILGEEKPETPSLF